MKNIDRKSYVCNNINVMNVISRFCRAVSAASYPALWCVSPSYKQGHKARNKKFRRCCEGIWTKKLIENINSGKKSKNSLRSLCVLFYLYLMIFLEQFMDLICWIHNSTDRQIVIQGINDQSQEFTHVCLDKVFSFVYSRRQICQVGCYDFIKISLFVVFIEFFKSVCEQSECGAYEYAGCVAVF